MGYAVWIVFCTIVGGLVGNFFFEAAWFAGGVWGFIFGVLSIIMGFGAVDTMVDAWD